MSFALPHAEIVGCQEKPVNSAPCKLWLFKVSDPGVPIQQTHLAELIQNRRRWRSNMIAAYRHTQIKLCETLGRLSATDDLQVHRVPNGASPPFTMPVPADRPAVKARQFACQKRFKDDRLQSDTRLPTPSFRFSPCIFFLNVFFSCSKLALCSNPEMTHGLRSSAGRPCQCGPT